MRKPKFKYFILNFGLLVAQFGVEDSNPDYYTEYGENDYSLDVSGTDLLSNLDANGESVNQYQPDSSEDSSDEYFGLTENDYEYSEQNSNEETFLDSDDTAEEFADTEIKSAEVGNEELGLSDYGYYGLDENDYDNTDNDLAESDEYDAVPVNTQVNIETEPAPSDSNSETQTQPETSGLNENLGLVENDYDYADNESAESDEYDVLPGNNQENIESESEPETQPETSGLNENFGLIENDYDYSNIESQDEKDTAYDYGLEPEFQSSEKEQKAPERQDPVTNQKIPQDSPAKGPVPESEKSNVVNLSNTDIMSCQTNRHVVELITSFLTGGQDNKEHPSSMSYGEYTSKFGTDDFDSSLLPEISAHRDKDKTALLEFNFLQLLQNYLLTEKAGNEQKFPLDASPAPFAKVMCLLMAEDMSNREYLGDARTVNCPNGSCQTTWFITPIWGFGCWCNFGQALMSGTGQPVHRADEICRDMQLCLRCAKKDAKNRGELCDPVTQTYNFTATAGGFEADCTASNNGDRCAVDTCCCEQQFLSDLLAEVFSPGWVYDASFKHDHGFNVEDNCPFGDDRQESDCCGKKPRRFPYNNTKRDCCKELNVFNPISQVCCSDGSVVSSTSSC